MADLAILVSGRGLKVEVMGQRPSAFQTPGGPLVLPVWILFNPPSDTENSPASKPGENFLSLQCKDRGGGGLRIFTRKDSDS